MAGGKRSEKVPAWRLYERVLACFEVDTAGMDVSVTPNASLVGSVSAAPRQIDVLVDARWETGTERRIVFDAKRRGGKLTVQDVDGFVGLMLDVRAARSVLVCTNGWTAAAESRAAETIELRLMTAEEADEVDHSAMEPCPHRRVLPRKKKGVVFWDGKFRVLVGGWAVVFTGKCDECRSFAFWCWACGEKKVVPDGAAHTCSCEWTWSVEDEDEETVLWVRTHDADWGHPLRMMGIADAFAGHCGGQHARPLRAKRLATLPLVPVLAPTRGTHVGVRSPVAVAGVHGRTAWQEWVPLVRCP